MKRVQTHFSVYLATSPSGKIYVGKTNNFPRRVGDHFSSARRGSKYAFHNAIRKYGPEVVFREVFCAFTEADALDLEIKLISELRSNIGGVGYSSTKGGDGVSGLKWSDKSRKRASESAKKRPQESIMRGSTHPNWGKPNENLRQQSVSGINWTEERKAKHSKRMSGENHPNFGKQLTPEESQRRSITQKRVQNTPEAILRARLSHLGKPSHRMRAVVASNGNTYPSITDAARDLSLRISGIHAVLSGRYKETGGYTFKYV
jgi:group I intron endonuclease